MCDVRAAGLEGKRLIKPGFGHILARRWQQSGCEACNGWFTSAPRSQMKRLLLLASLLTVAALPFSQAADAQHAEYNALVATHAQADGVPDVMWHLVLARGSRYT